MARQGKIQLIYVIVAPPDLAEEGKRLFQTHEPWMKSTHHRDGNKALLSYDVAIGPELSNPLDANSATTGNTVFVLNEIYEGKEGVADHFEQAGSSWKEFPQLMAWLGKCKVMGVPAAPIKHSLW